MKIGSYPTPVERHGSLWIKRDDLLSPLYGGNKVRKLEHLLAAATAAGKKRIVTIGAAGSHQIVATAIHGARAGFEVEAVIVAQPGSDHARENLRAAIAHRLRPIVAASWASAPALLSPWLGDRDAFVIPLGGSNAVGSLGYVDAAKELAAQVAAGVVPEPDVIVVALGSGGTAAGLAVGLEASGLRTRVIGVAISAPLRLVEAMARRMVKKTAELTGIRADAALARLQVDRRWLGRGYAYATRDGDRATAHAASLGLALDSAYTAKAFAAALDLATDASKTVLYWHTLSSAPMAPLLANAPRLPDALERLFR